MNVLLFGPPGSGKGTQAKDVAASLRIPHIATGDIFRKHLREGTDLGKLARSYMDLGQLVPDQVTCDLVGARLAEADASAGALLDGGWSWHEQRARFGTSPSTCSTCSPHPAKVGLWHFGHSTRRHMANAPRSKRATETEKGSPPRTLPHEDGSNFA